MIECDRKEEGCVVRCRCHDLSFAFFVLLIFRLNIDKDTSFETNMSYEEIDRANYENDVFTGGAEGRYAKPKATSEKKKRAPKAPTEDKTDENGQTDELVKTKKKTSKTHENGAAAAATADGEETVKPKKKRAPKIESNDENLNPVDTTEGEPAKKKKAKAPKVESNDENLNPIDTPEGGEPVKKKKIKAPKSAPIDGEAAPLDEGSNVNDLETPVKVKKSKKVKKPKATTDETFDDMQTNDYSGNLGMYLFIELIK